MKILAIETSCDETAAAVIEDGSKILSNIIASQAEIHARYGGVVPEVAARSHIEVIIPVIKEALAEADCDWDDIDAIAVTKGPGLIGSLLIGVMTAKTVAIAKNKPLIGVNHIWSHAFASFLDSSVISTNVEKSLDLSTNARDDKHKPQFPFLALTVSGGHTTLSLYKADLSRKVVGETLDDAAGEAFDKVAKLLGLPYPGGPAISKAAEGGNADAYKFPLAKLGKDSFDFSFSGLKTAVLRQVQELVSHPELVSGSKTEIPDRVRNDMVSVLPKTYKLNDQVVADIAASFQKAVVDALVTNTHKAYLQLKPSSVVVGGGVACNSLLRSSMQAAIPNAIFVPPVLCTDNAAMIGAMAFKMTEKGLYTNPQKLSADSSLEEI